MLIGHIAVIRFTNEMKNYFVTFCQGYYCRHKVNRAH